MFLRIIKDNVLRVLGQAYKEFSVETTIHGFKYTTLAKTRLERFIWIIILLLSSLAAGQLASLFYQRHQSTSMTTLIISAHYSTSMLELPALTLCHGGIAMTHKVVPYLTSQKPRLYMPRGLTMADFQNSIKYLREAIYPKNYFPDELDKLQQILSANRLSLLELFDNVNANCSNFLLMCQLEGLTVPCSELIEPVITPYGICCAFNYEYPRESLQRSSKLLKRYNSARIGSHFVLSLLMKSYSSQDRVASLIHGDGVKVMVHERNTHFSSKVVEFVAAAGHETIAQLDGVRLTSTPDVLELPARARGCSTDSHSNSRWNNHQSNCHSECRDSVIRKLCGCRPLSAVLAGPERGETGETGEQATQACDLTHVPCLARVVLRMSSIASQNPECTCLPDCESTTYRVALAAAPLNAARHSPRPFYKEVQQYQNVTALHLTFAGQTAMLQQRELMTSNVSLLSSLGGVFGLFLGCSIISIVEIFYFFCIFSISRFRNSCTVEIHRDLI